MQRTNVVPLAFRDQDTGMMRGNVAANQRLNREAFEILVAQISEDAMAVSQMSRNLLSALISCQLPDRIDSSGINETVRAASVITTDIHQMAKRINDRAQSALSVTCTKWGTA